MLIQKLVFCSQKVNSKSIRRENRRGVEHVIIPSFTLPPDIVMNGGLYPAEEVLKSFKSLNRTPVTIEHPEIDGQFVSANDPEVDFDFRFGAFNENATIMEDGRVAIDKVINVQKALKTEKGKRLLDRVNELETSKSPREIHTSVGVFVDAEQLDKPQVNEDGQEFFYIARNMIFDHDAILLDSVGAATPEQGTGIGINSEEIKVEHFIVNEQKEDEIISKAKDLRVNRDVSFSDITRSLHESINNPDDNLYNYVMDVFDGYFIYQMDNGDTFRSDYVVVNDNGDIEIQGDRLKVERTVEYIVVNTKQPNEDNAMRDEIIAKLKGLGIEVNAEISDADLLAKYEEAQLTANQGDDAGDQEAPQVNEDLTKTVQEQATEIQALKDNAKAIKDSAIAEKIKVIKSNKKYENISESSLIAIHADNEKDFDAMHQESIPSYGIGSTANMGNDDSDSLLKTNVEDLPE